MHIRAKSTTLLENLIKSGAILCPLCGEKLSLVKITKYKGFIQRGKLQCISCNAQFKIYARIPVLLPPGSYADWMHPLIETLFGYTRMSYEEIVRKYGLKKIRELYFKLLKGEYKPPKLYFKEPVDRKLLAEGAQRVTKKAIERHMRLIKEKTRNGEEYLEMIKYVKETNPERILDMCSGGGFFLASLLGRYKRFKLLLSIDIDYHCAKRVEGILKYYNLLDRAMPIVVDARTMPFKSNYFDVVTNNCGFNQILGYSKALHEAYRVLKPHGKLIVKDRIAIFQANNEELKSTIGFTREEIVKICKFCDIYTDKEDFLKLAKKIGFLLDEIKEDCRYFIAVLVKQ